MDQNQYQLIDSEYIKDWLVLGPFFPDDLERDFLANVGGEASVKPKDGDTVTPEDGRLLRWKVYRSSSDAVNLLDAIGVYEYATAYAFCNLVSSKEQPLELMLGSDDGVKAWLNGQLIHTNPISRSLGTFDRLPVNIREGVNPCLIKIDQKLRNWGFITRFISEESYHQYQSLKLELDVRRLRQDNQDVLAITPHRTPKSSIWKLPPPEPISIEIKDDASRLLATLPTYTEKTLEWLVPDIIQGTIKIIAKKPDTSEDAYKAQIKCHAHNIIPVKMQLGHWETYDVTRGLGGAAIVSIIQDKNDNMWFGSATNGVCRYDGRTFRTFTIQDGLPSNNISVIFEDSKGFLWFGTKNLSFREVGYGICRYDGENFQTFTIKDGLLSNAIIAIYADNRRHLWFGTIGGVSEFYDDIFHNYTAKDGLLIEFVGAIAQDADGNFWFGHGMKNWFSSDIINTIQYDGKSFKCFGTSQGMNNGWVSSITLDTRGNLWFGTSSGASKYNGEVFQNFTEEDGLASNIVSEVFCARNGDLWFATWEGVSLYRDGKFQSFRTNEGLAGNGVYSIAEDREGNLWFGTAGSREVSIGGSGVSRYDDSFANIPMEVTGAGIRDRHGNLWFAISGVGLGKYDGKELMTFHIVDGLPSGIVRSIFEDSRGNIWIGMISHSLVKYDGVSFQTFDYIRSNCIDSIYEDRKGVIWIGSQRIIYTYDGERFSLVADEQRLRGKLSGDHVFPTNIIEDSHGNMWFATLCVGITRYDGKAFTQFTTEEGLPDNRIYQLIEDHDGNIWMATAGGLCRYDGNSFQTFTTKDGLAGNGVGCVFEDSLGNIWFGVNAGGVYRFDGRNFQQLTVDDGLLSNTVYSILEGDGKMIFFTAGGITFYTPSKERIPPPVYVIEVTGDKIYMEPEELEIPATTPRITFSYRGLSFKTKRMRYNYMLEGYDKDWQATWAEEVAYEGLQPGDYVFKILAINRDLVYSEKQAIVKLKVIPDPRNHRIAQLEEQIRERERVEMERMRHELENARQIQQSLLPKKSPQISGFDIAGISLPAKEVSGDFYDYLSLDENLGIVLADVTGKSVQAAMVASMTNGMLHAEIRAQRAIWDSPGRILRELNNALRPRLMRMMYSAMTLGILQTDEKRLIFSNAGMPCPIVKRGKEAWELKASGLPLGFVDKILYDEVSFNMEPGDFVIFYSDGVIEATDETDEMYQTERLLEALQKADPSLLAQGMADWVIKSINEFVGNVEPSDDITIVVIHVVYP